MIFDIKPGDKVLYNGDKSQIFTVESLRERDLVTLKELFGVYPLRDITKIEPTPIPTTPLLEIPEESPEYGIINSIKEEIIDQLSGLYKEIDKMEREITEKKSVANGLERAINVINLESNFPKEERKELMTEIKKKINKI